MAMWPGLGWTWTTIRPTGIKGSTCLDKKGFQEKVEPSYVLIQPSSLPSFLDCTEHLGEDRLFGQHLREVFDQRP